MSTILDEIVANRKKEVREQKKHTPLEELKSKIDNRIVCNSLSNSLLLKGASGIIAEFKRQSPSKGIINERVQPGIVTKGYADAGVSGLSVLTDNLFFGGNVADFISARIANPFVPLLRKDFMVDEYQLYESRLLKADVILLIAAVLGKSEIGRAHV